MPFVETFKLGRSDADDIAVAAHQLTRAMSPTVDYRRSPNHGRSSEHAFTMFELIVAFVLIGMVVAVAAGAIMGSFSSASETFSTTAARARAAEAAEQFGSDVRTARSIGRDGAKIADPADLERAISTDGPLYDLDGNLLDWRDVVVAAPDRLVFQTDAVDEASGQASSPECVSWTVADAGSTWYVRRVVRAYTNRCAGGGGVVREDDRMTPPVSTAIRPRPGTRSVPALFTFVVARRAGSSCATTPVASTLTSADRNRLVGVRIDFSGIVQVRDTATATALRDEIALRSRSASDYQFAMGCGEG